MTQITKVAYETSTVIYTVCSIKSMKGLNREEAERTFQVDLHEEKKSFSVKPILKIHLITYSKSFHFQILEMFFSWVECIIIVLYMTSAL